MKKAILGILGVLVLIVVAGVLLLGNINSIMEDGIRTAGPEILGVPVDVSSVQISLLSGSGEIRGLNVANPKGYAGDQAIFIERIYIELDPMSVTSDKLRVHKLIIDGPVINFMGNLKDSNIQQLQRNAESFGGGASRVSATSATGASDGMAAAAGEGPVAEGEQLIEIGELQINGTKVAVALSFLRDQSLKLILPLIILENIGTEEDTSMSGAIDIVLTKVIAILIPMIVDSSSDLHSQLMEQGENLKQEAKKLQENFKESVDKLKSMFKRD